MKIINVKSGERYDVYVGRPSKFGNPFTHLKHLENQGLVIVSSREEAVECYRNWIQFNPELIQAVKVELKGKILGCHCYPIKPCHAEILLEIANS